jgi:hypothetical protein
MPDLRNYDPACVLDRLPRKGPVIREAIDWWLADVAPKLDGLRVKIIYNAYGFSPYGDPLPCNEAYLAIRMTTDCLRAEIDISSYVASVGGESLRRAILYALESLHRKLIDMVRQDPERWRRSIRDAYDY